MPNFLGAKAYPLLTFPAILVDSGPVTYTTPFGLDRGVTTPDFNARLRGKSTRVDKKPWPPYPP